MASRLIPFLLASAIGGLAAATPAAAQRMITPEQRIERLERQLQQVQRRVFPQGQPADTAGFAVEPAATQASVSNLDNRIGALERQIQVLVGQSEQNGFRLQQLEAEVSRLRGVEQRLAALEARVPAGVASQPPVTDSAPPTAQRPPASQQSSRSNEPARTPAAGPDGEAEDPGEEAYTIGFRLWRDGKYDQAISSLRAFTSAFPRHRRVSWANNLAGRAMLDKGEPRAAAEALLANYRANPKGERAADSLFYLGQALFKLDQPGQACKAYAELEAVYGTGIRDELKAMLPKAKADARC